MSVKEAVPTSSADRGRTILTIVGLLGLVVVSQIAYSAAVGQVFGHELTTPSVGEYLVLQTGVSVLAVAIGALYLYHLNVGTEFIDVRLPTTTVLKYAAIGAAVSLAASGFVYSAGNVLGVESTTAALNDHLAGNTSFLIALLAFELFIGAPVKAFLFFNVFQKRLYSVLSRSRAVAAGTLLFASYQSLFDLGGGDPIGLALSLGAILVHAFLLAYFYDRTRNLVTPLLINYLYNAIFFIAIFSLW